MESHDPELDYHEPLTMRDDDYDYIKVVKQIKSRISFLPLYHFLQTKMKLVEKQALDQCAAEYKKTKDELAKWETDYVAKIEACRKEQEQLNCQIKQVHERVCYTPLWLSKVLQV